MTVSEEIIKVLDDLSNRLGVAIDWSADNVIPYLQDLCGRYVQFEIARLSLLISIFTILGVVFLVLIRKHKDWGVCHYTTIDDDYTFRYMLYGISIVLIVVPIAIAAPEILECVFLPEMVIFEELKSFM